MELQPHDISRSTSMERKNRPALSWRELVARLGAERDLRAVLERPLATSKNRGVGSFDRVTARHLAQREKNEWPINPDDLTHEKPDAAISVRDVQKPADNNRDA